MSRPTPLIVAVVIAVAAAVAVQVVDAAAIRSVFVLPVFLVVPGFLTQRAIAGRDRDWVAEVAVAVALSLAVDAVVVIVLDAIGVRIDAGATTAALAVVCVLAFVPALRRAGTAATVREKVGSGVVIPALGSLAIAAAAIALAIVLAQDTPTTSRVKGDTSIAAVPAGGGTLVTVRSDETRSMSYVLTAGAGGQVTLTKRLTLRPGQAWRSVVNLPLPSRITLARTTAPATVYRQIVVTPPS